MNTTVKKGTALVTGASSGIGAVYATRLAQQGYDVILVARSGDRLQELAARLKAETDRAVKVVSADLSAAADVGRIEEILRTDASITMLVNNAGVGAVTPLLNSDEAGMEAMIYLNVTSLMRLTKAVVAGFVARGAGTVINISSIAALSPELLNGVYSGTKAFVLAFSQSLHHELAGKGVRVQAVLPGATATDFWNVAGISVDHFAQKNVMSAADMVDASLAGLEQGELVTIPSLPDLADWQRAEAARQALGPNLSLQAPAKRYGVAAKA
jgi:short-subunit dehydrogenase